MIADFANAFFITFIFLASMVPLSVYPIIHLLTLIGILGIDLMILVSLLTFLSFWIGVPARIEKRSAFLANGEKSTVSNCWGLTARMIMSALGLIQKFILYSFFNFFIFSMSLLLTVISDCLYPEFINDCRMTFPILPHQMNWIFMFACV